jgi:uncharacterized damage-inducible protein DinB
MTMGNAGLSGEELLAWGQRTVEGWQQLIAQSPAVLDVPCDVYGVQDLRGLIRHIVAVELRYAQRLAGETESPYEAIGTEPDAIFAAHAQAYAILSALVADPSYDWEASQEFVTISWGLVRSKRNTMFAHAVLHAVRHYGQAAMLARQAGFKPDWGMDYLAMDAVRVETN